MPDKPPNPFEQETVDPWDQGTTDSTGKKWFGPYKPQVLQSVLIVMSCPDSSLIGRVYDLKKKEVSIGRSQDADITVADPAASRRHCKVWRQEDVYFIDDLQSSNGTFVNGERVTESKELVQGDRIQIGSWNTVFKFTVQDELEKDFHESLYDGSYRDGLTGAFNKRYFDERLQNEFAFALRHQRALTVGLLDLDDFKKINDSHGHLAGDAVLRAVATLIERVLRTEDVFARIGGEEFALVLRDTEMAAAQVVGRRLLQAVEEHRTEVLGKVLAVTVSLGLATYVDGKPESPEDLVAAADEQLYAAKAAGKNTLRPD